MKRTLNTTINRSKNEKNDEHYTQLSVIEDEVRRNVCRWERMQTVTNFYDGWNLVREVEVRGIITNIIEYVWDKDLSGSFQGAGGVGGLLYEKRNGAIYIPFQDAYGNIMGYWDTNGTIVAEYTYDAFGKTISQSGIMSDVFRHRFSTKYLDAETGFYYYGYRYYFPQLRCWLNRDPLEEEGGNNLYVFCLNKEKGG
jgi:RHS repeat-associated protein